VGKRQGRGNVMGMYRAVAGNSADKLRHPRSVAYW